MSNAAKLRSELNHPIDGGFTATTAPAERHRCLHPVLILPAKATDLLAAVFDPCRLAIMKTM